MPRTSFRPPPSPPSGPAPASGVWLPGQPQHPAFGFRVNGQGRQPFQPCHRVVVAGAAISVENLLFFHTQCHNEFLHFFAAEPCAPRDKLVSVRRSACKPLLPGIFPGVSASLVRSISVLASLPRRPYPLQPVIRFSRFCACLQEPVYRKKRPFPVCPKRRKNARNPHISTLMESCYNEDNH